MVQKTNHRILVIGDRSNLRDSVVQQIKSCGIPSVTAKTDEEAMPLLPLETADLVVITEAVPQSGGLAVCRAIRSSSIVPTIVISARSSEPGVVEFLEAGADDHVASPFNDRELVARIEAAVRRSNMEPYRTGLPPGRSHGELEGVLQVRDVRLDLTTCRITVEGVVKTLTPNEFRLMAVFMRAPGEVFTREDLRRRVWPDDQHSLHLVEVHIANLRAKTEADPHHPVYIVTVRSRGYKFAIGE